MWRKLVNNEADQNRRAPKQCRNNQVDSQVCPKQQHEWAYQCIPISALIGYPWKLYVWETLLIIYTGIYISLPLAMR